MTNGAPDSVPAEVIRRPLDGSLRARFAAWALGLAGWHVVLARPVPMKCVIVFYPHTSNWDFAIGLLTKWMIAVPVRFIAKDTLFVGPFARLFAHWGGIPVNRRASTGVIAQLAARFAVESDFRLAIAPEGTRSRTEHWKSGFYYLALEAGVPLALAFIDYPRRRIGIGTYLTPTGDPAADMAAIAAFYADKTGRHPERAGPVRLADHPHVG
jgi:1-acyl-sn-glycerol-3-phosphate acyltransferase